MVCCLEVDNFMGSVMLIPHLVSKETLTLNM